MAIKFGEDRATDFAAGNLMTFAKSFSAMYGQPLDNREVWYDKAALEAAAQGTTMYVGQKVTFVDVENQKVYQYSVQLDGSLKEIGVAPVSDGATIAVDTETGKLSLFGVEGLDSGKTYVPSIVGGKLTWAEPDTSTAEGQQQAIDGLTTRMATAEGDIDKVEAAIGNAEAGLVKDIADNKAAIEAEATTARAAEKANADAIDALDTRVGTAETKIGTLETAVADRYTKSETDTKIAEEIGKQAHFSAKVVTSTDEMTDATTLYLIRKAGDEADIYEEYMVIDGTPTMIGDTTTDLTNYSTTEEMNTAIANAISDFKLTTDAAHNELKGRVDTLEGEFDTHVATAEATYATKTAVEAVAGDVTTLDGRMDIAEGEIDTLQGDVSTAQTDIQGLKDADTAMAGRVKTLEDVGAEKNVIAAVSSEFTVTEDTRTLGIVAIAADKVTGLSDALAGKVNTQTSEYNGEQVAWTLVSPENQEKLKALVIGESGVEISGTVNADNVEGLGAFITANRNTLGGLYPEADASKLLGIAAGAQVNVIEALKINGTAVSVTDKAVNIPVAGLGTLGVVMGSNVENGIAIAADGTMTINSLNVNKLTQTDGDELVINGGNA